MNLEFLFIRFVCNCGQDRQPSDRSCTTIVIAPSPYFAPTHLSDPVTLTATSVKNTRIGLPSALPR